MLRLRSAQAAQAMIVATQPATQKMSLNAQTLIFAAKNKDYE
jgi:hypothetical protein